MIQRAVSELRGDPLSGLRAIVASDRAGRPGEELAVTQAAPVDPAEDPFAEGHEDRTPPELYAVRPSGGAPDGPAWTVRVVPNAFPALSDDGPDPQRDAVPDLFTALPAHGRHEVIVNGPQPVSSLAELPVEQVTA